MRPQKNKKNNNGNFNTNTKLENTQKGIYFLVPTVIACALVGVLSPSTEIAIYSLIASGGFGILTTGCFIYIATSKNKKNLHGKSTHKKAQLKKYEELAQEISQIPSNENTKNANDSKISGAKANQLERAKKNIRNLRT